MQIEGQDLGKYERQFLIAKPGFGEVYKGI
jgi:hypothetical protein